MSLSSCTQDKVARSPSTFTPPHFSTHRKFGESSRRQGAPVQPKLMVGAPGDRYEQEADRIADRVMRMPAGRASTMGSPPQIQRVCAECEDELQRQVEEEEEEEELLQPKAKPGGSADATPDVSAQVHGLRGGGQPLPESTRAFFEPRFGHDFSQVRVHADQRAATSAQALNARAYTRGHDIAFAAGEYAPATSDGKRLMAHELTHVVQQGHADTSEVAVRRQANFSQVPSNLACPTSGPVSRPAGEDVLFSVSSNALTPQGRAQVANVVTNWQAQGGTDTITVDGYASVDGPQALNWRLSCQRAQAVESELISQGVPGSHIDLFAHGETNQFSASSLSQNRRATLSLPLPQPVPPTPRNRTVTINMTVLDGATNNAATDVTTSNNIFRNAGCALRVAAGTPQTLTSAQTTAVLRADGLLEEPSGPTVSQEERDLVPFNRSPNRLTAYYVPGFNPNKRGTSLQQPRHGVPDSLLMGRSAATDTFTHELGHILSRNSGHHPDANNLMASGTIRNVGVDNVTGPQCQDFLTRTPYPV